MLNMSKLTKRQIERQDLVDNEIFELMRKLTPFSKRVRWDIEMIGAVREAVRMQVVDERKIFSEKRFYP